MEKCFDLVEEFEENSHLMEVLNEYQNTRIIDGGKKKLNSPRKPAGDTSRKDRIIKRITSRIRAIHECENMGDKMDEMITSFTQFGVEVEPQNFLVFLKNNIELQQLLNGGKIDVGTIMSWRDPYNVSYQAYKALTDIISILPKKDAVKSRTHEFNEILKKILIS